MPEGQPRHPGGWAAFPARRRRRPSIVGEAERRIKVWDAGNLPSLSVRRISMLAAAPTDPGARFLSGWMKSCKSGGVETLGPSRADRADLR